MRTLTLAALVLAAAAPALGQGLGGRALQTRQPAPWGAGRSQLVETTGSPALPAGALVDLSAADALRSDGRPAVAGALIASVPNRAALTPETTSDGSFFPAIRAPGGSGVDGWRLGLRAGFGADPALAGDLYYLQGSQATAVGTGAATAGPNIRTAILQTHRPVGASYTALFGIRYTGTSDERQSLLAGVHNWHDRILNLSGGKLTNQHAGVEEGGRTPVRVTPRGWVVAGFVYDAALRRRLLYVDGLEILRDLDVPPPAVPEADFDFLGLQGSGNRFAFTGEWGRFVLYDRALTHAETVQATASVRGALAAAGVPTRLWNRVVFADGDSITGYHNTYLDLAQPLLGAETAVVKSAVYASSLSRPGNAEIESVFGRAARVAQITRPGQTTVATLLIGANDLGSGSYGDLYPTAESYYADILVWINLVRQAGVSGVGISTLLPNSRPGYNAKAAAVNALLDARLAAGDFDVLIDYRPTAMGQPLAETNRALYSDGVHPTPSGHAALAPVYAAAVQRLFDLSPTPTSSEPVAQTTDALAVRLAGPNPFRLSTTVAVALAENASDARVEVFDVLGRRVAELHTGPLAKGLRTFVVNAAGAGSGPALTPGVYVVLARASGEAASVRVVVAR